MKLFSFLVLLFALLGNGKATAFTNTIRVLNNLEQEETSAVVDRITKEEVLSSHAFEVNVRPSSLIVPESKKNTHSNFSIDRLTFYFSSRLRK